MEHLWLPARVGRLRCARETAPPTRPFLSLPKHIGPSCVAPAKAPPTRPFLSVPAHAGRLCCARETAPPTRPQERQAAGRAGGRDEPLERPSGGQGALARASHNSCAQDIGRHMPLGKKLRFPMRLLAARVALLLEVAWLPKHVGRRRGSSGEVCPPTRPSRERRAALACELMCSDYMHSACV